MCLQVLELYSACRCLYYKYRVDTCSARYRPGHEVTAREVLVGYTCSNHASSSVYQPNAARSRRQGFGDGGVEATSGPSDLYHYASSEDPVGDTGDPATVLDGPDRDATNASGGPVRPTAAATNTVESAQTPTPPECGSEIRHDIERGDVPLNINRGQLYQAIEDVLAPDLADLPRNLVSQTATQPTGLRTNGSSHATSDGIELQCLRNLMLEEAPIGFRPQEPASRNTANENQYFTTSTRRTTGGKERALMRPCYILIFLGFLTIIGSLVPGVWQANLHNDMSAGFSLAQYILGVGIFAVGSMVAIHVKTCECWESAGRASLADQISH